MGVNVIMLEVKDYEDGYHIRLYDAKEGGNIDIKHSDGWKNVGKTIKSKDLKYMDVIFQKPMKEHLRIKGSWGVNQLLVNYLKRFSKDTTINIYIECLEKNKIYKAPLEQILKYGEFYQANGWDKQLHIKLYDWEIVNDFQIVDYSIDI